MTNGYRFLAAFLRSPSFFKPQGAAAEKIWLTPDCASSSLTAVGSSLVVGFTAARRLPTAAHSQRSPSPLARAFARRYRSSRPAPPPLSASSSPSLSLRSRFALAMLGLKKIRRNSPFAIPPENQLFKFALSVRNNRYHGIRLNILDIVNSLVISLTVEIVICRNPLNAV